MQALLTHATHAVPTSPNLPNLTNPIDDAPSVGRTESIFFRYRYRYRCSVARHPPQQSHVHNFLSFSLRTPSHHPPTLRESTALSADADDSVVSVVQPPNNVLIKPVVLPAAVANAPTRFLRRCPRRCRSNWPTRLYSSLNRRQTLPMNKTLISVLLHCWS